MLKLDGLEVSNELRTQLKVEISKWSQGSGRSPGLSVILVGDDPASEVYVRNKVKSCEQVGIESNVIKMPETSSYDDIKEKIENLNLNPKVDGILLQLPLPQGLDERKILELISPDKDPDGLTISNNGLLFCGDAKVQPCTPSGVMEILKFFKIPVQGKKAVVVGRSHIVGLPMFYLLQQANATVTLCHSKTEDLLSHTKEADIVVVAAGRPEFLGKEAFKENAVVIDVGIHRKPMGEKTKLVGDVKYDELEGWAYAATPVPKGVGPMTITMLLKNTFDLAKSHS